MIHKEIYEKIMESSINESTKEIELLNKLSIRRLIDTTKRKGILNGTNLEIEF